MKINKLLFVLLAASSLFLLSCESKNNSSQGESLLEPSTFLAKLKTDQGTLIDVRTPKEFNAGSIPEAINIDFRSSEFEEQISAINRDTPLYLFCRSGGRSSKAFKKAKNLGFAKVYDMKGGYLEYSNR